MNPDFQQSLKHNIIVNLLDGSFFGFALGFASFVTVIPLFVSTMTDSAILIGLIPAIHNVGWQLPQLLTVNRVSRQTRYKPMVLLMTIQERLPFFLLAIVAWLMPVIGIKPALILTFMLLIWQGLGGGFTATAWTAMIGKIIPSERRGTFFGLQSAAANLLASVSAIFAGYILETWPSPQDYIACFLLTSASMVVSWIFLAQTREPAAPPAWVESDQKTFWAGLGAILRNDRNFRWFLVARMFSQVALMGTAFYTVYAVRFHGMSEVGVGLLTAVLLATNTIANPIMGWIGDRWSQRSLLEIGILAAAASALIAWWSPSVNWFYLVYILSGIANVTVWTVGLAMILEFGTESQRPAYIGLANTLVAPFTILAPFIGGLLADSAGYPAAFMASAAGGLVTALVLHLRVRDPRYLASIEQ